MKSMSVKSVAAGLVLLASGAAAWAQAVVKCDGSSTVFPIAEAVAEEFQNANKNIQVTVGMSGTGGGFKKFVRGETDISNASRPIQAKEMEEAAKNGIEYIELPIAFDALTVVVNKDNTFLKELTIADLKKMWEPEAQGKVMRWNQVRPEWPDQALNLFGAGSDSGTFEYFTEAACGKSKASRGDYTASEDDNTLVTGVSRDKHALGYFGYAYFAANQDKLRAVPVVNKAGKAVAPGESAVKDGTYNPLSRPLFIYVNKKSLDKPEVRKFAEFFITKGAEMAAEVKYVPLPADAYTKDRERLASRQVGTAFGGHNETGLHIDDLMSRPLTLQPKQQEGEKKDGEAKKDGK
ncbi:MAG: PstS family phosphate ABC transporter substrate-binding protein [Phycisphaerales bacterium]